MNSLNIEGVDKLMNFYSELETEINVVRKAANFYCIDGCGACCHTPSKNLEVSLFEAIPIAQALIKQGTHEAFLAQLEQLDCDEMPCVLYASKSPDGKLGSCSQYEARALICRLFGSAIKCGSHDDHLPIICKPLKSIHFGDPEKVKLLAASLPVAAKVSAIARGFNVQLSSELFSMNEAIRRALYYVLQRMDYDDQA